MNPFEKERDPPLGAIHSLPGEPQNLGTVFCATLFHQRKKPVPNSLFTGNSNITLQGQWCVKNFTEKNWTDLAWQLRKQEVTVINRTIWAWLTTNIIKITIYTNTPRTWRKILFTRIKATIPIVIKLWWGSLSPNSYFKCHKNLN